jgi:hypothetical protein
VEPLSTAVGRTLDAALSFAEVRRDLPPGSSASSGRISSGNSKSCGSSAPRMAARQTVGGRRAHQMCKRFCGGRWRALLSRWHSADRDAQGSPASSIDGLARRARSLKIGGLSLHLSAIGFHAGRVRRECPFASRRAAGQVAGQFVTGAAEGQASWMPVDRFGDDR